MATIKEISEQASVSIATVSKVLNDLPGISDETRKKVLAVANKLNYRPNLNARHLKTGVTRTLGIIAEDITVFNTPGIIDGIGVSCESRKFHYIMGNLRFNQRFGHKQGFNKEKEELIQDMTDEMISKRVDGILYIGCHSHVVAPFKSDHDTPFACAYCYSNDKNVPSVVFDDRQAAYKVAELLINRKHTKIGVVAGQPDSLHTSNRILGFQEALFDYNIPYNPHMTFFGEWEHQHGFKTIPKLIKLGVTAIFAHNDLIALGILDYCRSNGIDIGKDFAVIGFDNRNISEFCRPSLSTVALPLFEIGHKAASLLLDTIEKKVVPEDHEIKLDCQIIERDSTMR